MASRQVAFPALIALLAAGCGSPTGPSVFTSITGTWAGRYEQLSCTMPVDTRPCAFNRVGSVRLTLVQRGNEVEGRVEFWSDNALTTQPLIGPLPVTGTFASASLSLAGSNATPTPWGNIERTLHDWETRRDPGTGRMHGSTALTVGAPNGPDSGPTHVSKRVYRISALGRVAW